MAQEQTQAQRFANQLLSDAEELASYLDGLSAAQWQAVTSEEGWPLTLTVEHVALGFENGWSWIRTLLDTGAWPELTGEDIDAANNAKAAEQVHRDPAETLAYLRRAGMEVHARVGALSDANLARSAPFPLMDGRDATVALLIGRVIPRHFAGHAASIRAGQEPRAKNEATA